MCVLVCVCVCVCVRVQAKGAPALDAGACTMMRAAPARCCFHVAMRALTSSASAACHAPTGINGQPSGLSTSTAAAARSARGNAGAGSLAGLAALSVALKPSESAMLRCAHRQQATGSQHDWLQGHLSQHSSRVQQHVHGWTSLYRRRAAPPDWACLPLASLVDCLPPALALQGSGVSWVWKHCTY